MHDGAPAACARSALRDEHTPWRDFQKSKRRGWFSCGPAFRLALQSAMNLLSSAPREGATHDAAGAWTKVQSAFEAKSKRFALAMARAATRQAIVKRKA